MIKRRQKRFPIAGTATLRFEDEGKNRTIPGVLSNISTVGMGLYTNNPIEANKQVSVTINFISTDGIEDSVIEGSVIFKKDLGNIHFVGIQFNEYVNSKNQPVLFKHIQKILAFDKLTISS
jgi:hypothetical protein